MSLPITKPTSPLHSGWGRFLAVAILIAVSVYLLVVTRNRVAEAVLPDSYRLMAVVDLAEQAHRETVLAEFSLTEPTAMELYFSLQSVDTSYLDLSLVAADGRIFLILHSEDYRTDEAGSGTWRETLLPGDYRLLLSAAQGQGKVTIYSEAK